MWFPQFDFPRYLKTKEYLEKRSGDINVELDGELQVQLE